MLFRSLGHCGRLDTTLSWRIKIRSDLWNLKEASEGYYRAEFYISNIFNYRDNSISISISYKLVKGVYFFSELHKSCLKNQVELIPGESCRIDINIGF